MPTAGTQVSNGRRREARASPPPPECTLGAAQATAPYTLVHLRRAVTAPYARTALWAHENPAARQNLPRSAELCFSWSERDADHSHYSECVSILSAKPPFKQRDNVQRRFLQCARRLKVIFFFHDFYHIYIYICNFPNIFASNAFWSTPVFNLFQWTLCIYLFLYIHIYPYL